MSKCEVCQRNDSVSVASVPFVPISVAWCKECLAADVIPWWIAVANTAICGGREHCNEEWLYWVDNTVTYFGKTVEVFDAEVAQEISEMEEREAEFFGEAPSETATTEEHW